MRLHHLTQIIFAVFMVSACASKRTIHDTSILIVSSRVQTQDSEQVNSTNLEIPNELKKREAAVAVSDTTFVNLLDYSSDFVYNMKYATVDNFLHSKVYDCEACYLRYRTVKSLIRANEKFLKKGYRIMLYDCYRPISIQRKMFEIVSNPKYVADPKKGSIHNRGGAVDISLVDSKGEEVNMGTPFDFFGVEASHEYENLSDEVKTNRKLLRKVMTQNNFRIFESEWWHYNLKNAQKDPVSNFKWNCN